MNKTKLRWSRRLVASLYNMPASASYQRRCWTMTGWGALESFIYGISVEKKSTCNSVSVIRRMTAIHKINVIANATCHKLRSHVCCQQFIPISWKLHAEIQMPQQAAVDATMIVQLNKGSKQWRKKPSLSRNECSASGCTVYFSLTQ